MRSERGPHYVEPSPVPLPTLVRWRDISHATYAPSRLRLIVKSRPRASGASQNTAPTDAARRRVSGATARRSEQQEITREEWSEYVLAESEAAGQVNDDSQPRVEPFDACYATEFDPVRAIEGGSYSAHPFDPQIVPPRTATEQAQLAYDREGARRRDLARLQSDPEAQALAADIKDALRDARGNVVPRNDGAYRHFDAIDARARELQAEGCDHDIAVALAAEEVASGSRAPDDEPPEKAHYSPDDPRYLGTSVRSLMGAGTGHPKVAPPQNVSIAPDQTQLEQGGTSATGKSLRPPCHGCGYRNAYDARVCQQCGSQFYLESRRGRPSEGAKRERVNARVSAAAKKGLEAAGCAGDEIEVLGLALCTGRTFEAVRAMSQRERTALRGIYILHAPATGGLNK